MSDLEIQQMVNEIRAWRWCAEKGIRIQKQESNPKLLWVASDCNENIYGRGETSSEAAICAWYWTTKLTENLK